MNEMYFIRPLFQRIVCKLVSITMVTMQPIQVVTGRQNRGRNVVKNVAKIPDVPTGPGLLLSTKIKIGIQNVA